MICDERRIVKRSGTGERLRNTFRYRFDLSNGNLTRIHNTDGGGEDYNMEFDALNRLVRYNEATAGEKGIFSYNCAGLLAGREVDGDITKFGYDVYSVLDMITKPNGNELGFDFDMLGRLRRYGTDTRESTFNYDGTKRFGDFNDGWKRYHWCKSQFLGYEDDTNTFYIVPDIHGSTKVIFTHAGTIVNRLDYDTLGKIRNQDTTPQVELLWRGMYWNDELSLYTTVGFLYSPTYLQILKYNKTGIPLCDNMPEDNGGSFLCEGYKRRADSALESMRYWNAAYDWVTMGGGAPPSGYSFTTEDYEFFSELYTTMFEIGGNPTGSSLLQNNIHNAQGQYERNMALYKACKGHSLLQKIAHWVRNIF